MDKLILIDGNNIIYRAFFAMPPLTNTAGQQTNAVYGFTTMLLRLIEEHKPTHMIVAFDAGKITFRHEGYEDYKGGRQKTPPELSEQFPMLKDLLRNLGVPQFEIDGYEADDIIGSISREADEAGRQVMIVSGDKDMLQLASEHTTVALVRKGVTEVEMYGPRQIREKYDLTPQQIIDLKGLMGDASDNIPGVPGVGEKTALKLLQQFGSVEGVLAGTDELKGKMKEKLEEHADSAIMSKKLATIYREVPLEHAWEDMVFTGIRSDTAGPALAKLEFKSLLERLSLSAYAPAGGNSEEGAEAVEAAVLDITIVHEAELPDLIAALPGISALHVESNGENPHRAEVIGIGLSSRSGTTLCRLSCLRVLQQRSCGIGWEMRRRRRAGTICTVQIWRCTGRGLLLPERLMMFSWLLTCWTRRKPTRICTTLQPNMACPACLRMKRCSAKVPNIKYLSLKFWAIISPAKAPPCLASYRSSSRN